jgi:hypothetical protein
MDGENTYAKGSTGPSTYASYASPFPTSLASSVPPSDAYAAPPSPAAAAPSKGHVHKHRHHSNALLALGVVAAIGLALWWFGTQSVPPATRKSTIASVSHAGTTQVMLEWSSDAADPKPVLIASPALQQREGGWGRGAPGSRQQLMGFAPQFAGATCSLSAASLKTALVAMQLQDPDALTELVPPGIEAPSLKCLAVTPMFKAKGTTLTHRLLQAALWLTPYGLIIGDPKLQAKTSSRRMFSTEVQEAVAEYAVASASDISDPGNPVVGSGGGATTPIDLVHPDNLTDVHADRLMHFRTPPFAFWSWYSGVTAPGSPLWPFVPTIATTPVVWSTRAAAGDSVRFLEFLGNGELRVVDRDPHDGSLTKILWTASSDTTRTPQHGCVF